MGRWTVKILVLAALLWGGWWWFATTSMQRNVQAWLDVWSTQGLETSVASMARGGFPMTIATTLTDTKLTDPSVAATLDIPQINLSAPIYWPGDVTVKLPDAPITLTTPQGVMALTSNGIEAAIQLHPGTSLQLEGMQADTTALVIEMEGEAVASVEAIVALVKQGLAPETYDLALSATGFSLGDSLRDGFDLPDTWPTAFEPLIARMTVTFDRPWDQSALHLTRPQPRTVSIDKIEAIYGGLGLTIGGDLQINENGVPAGLLQIKLRNWEQMLDLAVATSAVPLEWAPTAQTMLGFMSNRDGTLDLDITLQDGQMRAGFLPLGPAPLIIIP